MHLGASEVVKIAILPVRSNAMHARRTLDASRDPAAEGLLIHFRVKRQQRAQRHVSRVLFEASPPPRLEASSGVERLTGPPPGECVGYPSRRGLVELSQERDHTVSVVNEGRGVGHRHLKDAGNALENGRAARPQRRGSHRSKKRHGACTHARA
jgi:hypothetical protein